MPRLVDVAERRTRLARRHLLLPEDRTDDVAAIADALVVLHSSDPVTVHLSAMARMRHPTVAAVEAALYGARSVVRHHAMRRTLWVGTPDVVRLVHAAATRRLAAPEHRRTAGLLADNGVEDPEQWLVDAREQVLAVLDEHGPLTARALGRRVTDLRRPLVMAPGKSYSATVSAHTRVLLGLGFAGQVVRTRPAGTWVSGAYAFAPMRSWLPGGLDEELSEREAAGALALRWLRAFGPGTADDLRWWAGWTKATTRAALTDSGAVEVAVAEGPAFVAPGDEDPVPPVGPWVAVLPGLDPTTMGWKQRGFYLPKAAARAFDRMGNAGPTIWVDGKVAGVWVQDPEGGLRSHLFAPLDGDRRAAVDERLAQVAATVGGTRFTVRFPSPVSTALLRGTTPPV